MEDFINGFNLFFNPSKAKDLYFKPKEVGIGRHFHNAFRHLAKAFNVEKENTIEPKNPKHGKHE